jgi:enterochelin esterase family protein
MRTPVIIRSFLFVLFSLFLLQSEAQVFGEFIEKLRKTEQAKRQEKVDSFRLLQTQYPLIESDSCVYFILYSSVKQAAVAGDATGWKPFVNMNRIENTNLWYAKACYEHSARLEYKFVLNGSQWVLDSLNPNLGFGGFGSKSVLMMPGYKLAPELQDNILFPKGTIQEKSFFSKSMQEERKFMIYLPPGFAESGKKYNLVVFNDGEDYLKYTKIREILDNMASDGLPLIAVFAIPVQRDPEYSGGRQNAYTTYVSEELIPYLINGYRVLPEPTAHAIAGISNGGNIALWLGIQHPEVFGGVVAQSSNITSANMKAYAKANNTAVKVYLNIGKYDIPELIPMFEKFTKILKEKNYNYKAPTYPEGHNWGFWDSHIKEAIFFLFR